MQKTFMTACREFFGVKEGQTGLQFGREVQALTHADKVEIREGIMKSEGWDIAPIQSTSPAAVAA